METVTPSVAQTKTRRANGEGSIVKRSDGRWMAVVEVGGKRRYVYARTRKEVVAKLHALQRDAQKGVTGTSLTVGQYLDQWLTYCEGRVRPQTLDSLQRQVRVHLVPALGTGKLEKLAPQDVDRWLKAEVAAGGASGSIRLRLAILKRALKQAVKWGLLARNVAELVDPPRQERPVITPLSAEEARRLIEVASEGKWGAVIVLALTTGMRESELLGLRWQDVDLDHAVVRVTHQIVNDHGRLVLAEPKSASSRRAIPLPEMAVSALREHRRNQIAHRLQMGERWQEMDLVFPNEVGGPMDRTNFLGRVFKPLLAKAGLRPVRFHDLRHTTATLLLEAGEHPKVVQERLGHSTIGVTMDLYTHVVQVLQNRASDRLSALLSERKLL